MSSRAVGEESAERQYLLKPVAGIGSALSRPKIKSKSTRHIVSKPSFTMKKGISPPTPAQVKLMYRERKSTTGITSGGGVTPAAPVYTHLIESATRHEVSQFKSATS